MHPPRERLDKAGLESLTNEQGSIALASAQKAKRLPDGCSWATKGGGIGELVRGCPDAEESAISR